MGEANYYLTAEFESEKKLNGVFKDIKKFIKQGKRAEEFWDKNRNSKRKEFWENFKRKFPLIYEYLGELVEGDNNNDLAGEIDFGMDNSIPTKRGVILEFSERVWHFSSWDRLAEFLKVKFGAKKVDWYNDEVY